MKTTLAIIITLHASIFTLHDANAQIINIPGDFPTIQEGINAAASGDTVLVQPGTYIENINYNGKNIVVASLFLLTQDTGYIFQTIINGDSVTSVVTFNNGEDSTAFLNGFTITNGSGTDSSGYYNWETYGGGIYISGSQPSILNTIIEDNIADYGGGVYYNNGGINMINTTITNNLANEKGGGFYYGYGVTYLSYVSITGNIAKYGGGVYFENTTTFNGGDHCSIYHNYALQGNDIYAYDPVSINLTIDTFSVLCPMEYHLYPIDNFMFDILHGKILQVEADLYVSTDGDNNNSGLTILEPLKNIRYAFSKIITDELHPHAINLLGGTYSHDGNGDIYPLNIPDYVNLVGESESATILDGSWMAAVIRTISNTGTHLQNLTVTHGQGGTEPTGGAPYNYAGGITCHDNSNLMMENISVIDNSSGIYCTNSSSPTIQNATIDGNQGTGWSSDFGCNAEVSNTSITNNSGPGIVCEYSAPVFQDVVISGNTASGLWCDHASPVLKNVQLTNNTSYNGGGLLCYGPSYPTLENVTIAFNSSIDKGGGICCEYNAKPVFDTVNRCNIYMNQASVGHDYYAEVNQDVVVDTFTVLHPSSYYAYPISKYTYNILNSKINLIDDDLYVSPDGDNNNSGLSQEEPMRNIDFAFSMIMADNTHINTIHLLDGIYSPSTNGESFPVYMLDYTNLTGESEEDVILDPEGQARALIVNNNQSNHICNITLTNGYGNNSYPTSYAGGVTLYNSNVELSDITISNNTGGGISCLSCSPELENISIINNGGIWGGGGLYTGGASPVLINVLISGNQAYERGGGAYFNYNSNPVLKNVTISNNMAAFGGGICCSWGSDPNLYNTILWNNSPQEIFFNNENNSNSISISYCDIQGGEAGIVTNGNGTVYWLEGNIDQDPLFTGTGSHPYALSDDSPCVDAGSPDTTGLNLPTSDLMGNYRLWDGDSDGDTIVDMGAYEFGSLPVGIPGSRFQVPGSGFRVEVFPNPAGGIVDCRLSIFDSRFVTLKVHDLYGREVRTLLDELKSPGEYSVRMDVSDLPAGVYLVRLQAGGQSAVKKLVVH